MYTKTCDVAELLTAYYVATRNSQNCATATRNITFDVQGHKALAITKITPKHMRMHPWGNDMAPPNMKALSAMLAATCNSAIEHREDWGPKQCIGVPAPALLEFGVAAPEGMQRKRHEDLRA